MTEPAAPATSKLRLFAAVEVPDAVAASVRAATMPLRRAHAGLRWTEPDGWHVTLVFLGSVPDRRLDDVRDALGRAAARAAPFPLALTGAAGTFGSGVLWAGLEEQPALARLAAVTTVQLRAVVALPDEGRPFRPHLTLARARGRSGGVREAAAGYRGPAVGWDVERLVLMRSHLSPHGARYEVVGAWALSG